MNLARNSPYQGYPEDGSRTTAETSDYINPTNDGNSPNTNSNYTPSSTITRHELEIRYGPELNRFFRQYEKTMIKLAKEANHLTFLYRARENNIIHKGLIVKPPVKSIRAERIAKRASQALVRERINYHRITKNRLKQQCERIKQDIRNATNDQDYEDILTAVQRSYTKTNNQMKEKHRRKLSSLMNTQRENRSIDPARTVINLSSKQIDQNTITILNKGMKFAIAPKEIPTMDMVSAIEVAAQKIQPPEAAEEYRWRARSAIDNAKSRSSKNNITKAEFRSLKELKADRSLKILPADKGNATVIMDVETYDEKIQDVLRAGQYKELKRDPTTSVETQIYKTLHKHRAAFPNQSIRYKLTPHYSKPPHLYGLPKIHKPDIPLRPIVSSRNSPCHPLAKFLLDIITPISGNTQSAIRNTEHFVNQIKNLQLQPEDIMVSFDVTSLFTNVPTEPTLTIVKNRLSEDDTLHERTTLSTEAIIELLSTCVNTTYFQVGEKFYQQEFGMAMGSPLSPILSNVYMEEFEQRAINTYHLKPKMWLRYVDDTFVIWPHGEDTLEGFLQHLNSIEDSIKFTMELQTENRIPFLDVLVHKIDNGTLRTKVYKKPTNTGQYLHFDSNHPHNVKIGAARCLYDRARKICSEERDRKEEEENITNTLKQNGYPERTLTKAREGSSTTPEPNSVESDTICTTVIPYVRGLSEKIRRIGNEYKIRTAIKTTNTTRSILTRTKPDNVNQRTKNCVYKVPCECGRSYIGETSRPLQVRIKEHKNLVRLGETEKSRLAQHAWEEDHNIKWNDATILEKEEHPTRRKLKEAAYIATIPNTISTPSLEIKNIWLPIVRDSIATKTRSTTIQCALTNITPTAHIGNMLLRTLFCAYTCSLNIGLI